MGDIYGSALTSWVFMWESGVCEIWQIQEVFFVCAFLCMQKPLIAAVIYPVWSVRFVLYRGGRKSFWDMNVLCEV